jgi:hypothetical protein
MKGMKSDLKRITAKRINEMKEDMHKHLLAKIKENANKSKLIKRE